MKLSKILLPVFLAAAAAVACAAPARPVAGPDSAPAPTPVPAEGEGGAPAAETMALIVSFYSPGNGPNIDAVAKLEAIVEATSPKPARKSVAWGREGEHDECFTLGEMDAAQKEAFIDRVVREVGSMDRVNILRDEPCRAGR